MLMASGKRSLTGPPPVFDSSEIVIGVLTLACAFVIVALAVYSAAVL
jgi:hypothetical protein